MTSLPTELPQSVQCIANIVSAYNICLRLEKSLQEDIDNGKDVGLDMICSRVLGYLILFAQGYEGLKIIVHQIHTCANDTPKLLAVGKLYFDDYIWAFRANRSRIRTPSTQSSRSSYDSSAKRIGTTLVEAPQSYADAKSNALIRDRYRCVVTGKYDWPTVSGNRELQEVFRSDPDAKMAFTQCAHIFTESSNLSIAPGTDKRSYAAAMWAAMDRFDHKILLPTELNGSGIHRLPNVMTMEADFHNFFDRFYVWFVPTKEKNKYKLESSSEFVLHQYPTHVTFTTSDPIKLPVPSPTYLAMHAACAKIAHLSGAAEYTNKFYRDMEDSTTLDADGASAHMLEHALIDLRAVGYEVVP
ncbi:hypothetical protein BDQ12DRAFT_692868 [Crucibulum laeve]|uniref:HNH nuclease domain-containing protein n=1 Tax=Crucibulum laeve TaxID=68775 RepID=A0A5C3LJ02_9AGAR|nr:hypothetical protein BDQ12DRAFT_692868 [Crucibulum laeve]